MNDYLNFLILLIISIILIIILKYLSTHKETFLDYNIPFPTINDNNNTSNYQFINKSLYVPFLQKNEKKFLGWYKWRRENIVDSCINKPDLNKQFKNYLNNTNLRYDGLWDKNHVDKKYYDWKLQCPSQIGWKKTGTEPQKYWQPQVVNNNQKSV